VPLAPDAEGRPREAIVLRDGRGVPRAYVNLCKHLPIPLDAGSRDFIAVDGTHLLCGTHGALYRREDGLCVDGPCEGESLDALELVDDDGQLVLLDDALPGGDDRGAA